MIERIQLAKRSYLQRESDRPGAELKRTLTNDAITFEGQKRERKEEKAPKEEALEQTSEPTVSSESDANQIAQDLTVTAATPVAHVDIRV